MEAADLQAQEDPDLTAVDPEVQDQEEEEIQVRVVIGAPAQETEHQEEVLLL